MTKSLAWKQGVRAYGMRNINPGKYCTNPYNVATGNAYDWDDGWDYAQAREWESKNRPTSCVTPADQLTKFIG